MAQRIVTGLSTYLVDFTNAQNDPTRIPYVNFTQDLDQNFVRLQSTVNQLIDEVNAVQGPNAGLSVDTLVFDDPNRIGSSLVDPAQGGIANDSPGPNRTGFIGRAALAPTLASPPVRFNMTSGVMLVGGMAIRSSSNQTPTTSGASGARYIAIDINGAFMVSETPNQAAADLWQVMWNGTAFIANSEVRQNRILFDGDAYEAMLTRPATGSDPVTFEARIFESFHERMEEVERRLAGFSDDGRTPPRLFGALAIDAGSAAAPGLAVNGDGASGLFQPANNTFAIATSGNEAIRWDAQGNVDLPRNSRVQAVRSSAQTFAGDGTQASVAFDAPDGFDIGSWHNPDASPLNEQVIVPAGADGLYHLCFEYDFEDGVDPTQDVGIYITLNGVVIGTNDIARFRTRTVSGEPLAGSLTTYANLVSGGILRVAMVVNTSQNTAYDLNRGTFTVIKKA